MATNNLFSWFAGGSKKTEMDETRAQWVRVDKEWHASPLAGTSIEDLAARIVELSVEKVERKPAAPVIAALCEATETLLAAESIGDIEPLWSVIESNVTVAVEFRSMLARRSRWATEYNRVYKAYLLRYAQESAFREDARRQSNGEQVRRVTQLALTHAPSIDFAGYYQRHVKAS